jgi:hypothetical protein
MTGQSKHLYARGRIALSGGNLRPRGPVGGHITFVSCEGRRKIGAGFGDVNLGAVKPRW